jgi:hypothetical protein
LVVEAAATMVWFQIEAARNVPQLFKDPDFFACPTPDELAFGSLMIATYEVQSPPLSLASQHFRATRPVRPRIEDDASLSSVILECIPVSDDAGMPGRQDGR